MFGNVLCAPHTASRRAGFQKELSPEPVGLTWITDWAGQLQQAGKMSQVQTYARSSTRRVWDVL